MDLTSSSRIPLFVSVADTVPIADLSSEQQGTLKSVIQAIYLQNASRDARQSQKEIASIITEGADFCWQILHGVKSFGCEIALRDEKGEKVFIPLSDPDRLRRMSNGMIFSKEAMDSGVDVSSPSETAPSSVPVSALPVKNGEDNTLQTAAAQAAQKENRTVLLDDELLEKPALIIGAENAASDTQLRALCAAYGLRMRTIPEGDKRNISRYPVTVSTNLTDLHGAVLAAVPSPFMRALVAMEARPQAGPASIVTSSTGPSAGFDSVSSSLAPFVSGNPQVAPETQFSRRLPVIRSAAARKLRSTLEAKVAASKAGRVSLNQMSLAERSAFANVLMVDYLTCLGRALTSTVSTNITNFDRSAITCRRVTTRGLPCVAIAFFSPAGEGQPLQGDMAMVIVDRSGLLPPEKNYTPPLWSLFQVNPMALRNARARIM